MAGSTSPKDFVAAAKMGALGVSTQDDATPWWARHSRSETARLALTVRLNTRHMEALRRMANPEMGLSMGRVARNILVPAIEEFIQKQAAKQKGQGAT